MFQKINCSKMFQTVELKLQALIYDSPSVSLVMSQARWAPPNAVTLSGYKLSPQPQVLMMKYCRHVL